MQAVQLEREQNNIREAYILCEDSLKFYSDFPKLWMIAAQLKEELSPNYEEASDIYIKAVIFIFKLLD